MNTNMIGFRWFFKNLCIFVLWKKLASALEGLSVTGNNPIMPGDLHDNSCLDLDTFDNNLGSYYKCEKSLKGSC